MLSVAAVPQILPQQKIRRKRFVTKNEMKRIMIYSLSQLPCSIETCKLEKRELHSLIKRLEEQLRLKDASVKTLRENLAAMRLTIREFSCFIATSFPGTKVIHSKIIYIAKTAQIWEKRWKTEDEEGKWNSDFSKLPSAVLQNQSEVKPSTSANPTSCRSIVYSDTAKPVASQQINTSHERIPERAWVIWSPEERSFSLAASNNDKNNLISKKQMGATAHALITVNEPLNLPMSAHTNGNIVMAPDNCNNTLKIVNPEENASRRKRNYHMTSRNWMCGNSNVHKDSKFLKPEICSQHAQNNKVFIQEKNDVIVISDDDNDEKMRIGATEDVVRVPRYDSLNLTECRKYHPLVYPKLTIYPGLRISRLHIKWVNSSEGLKYFKIVLSYIEKSKHIILNIQYAGEHSKQVFHILYYIRSMVEKEEADGWTKIYSKECEAHGNSRLLIQFDRGEFLKDFGINQKWISDAIYFTGFIECGFERYGAYADVCKVELGSRQKQVLICFIS
ncbi:unnamed protein product [Thelazia callipaeda]|uniref:MATH domain-containing protein n=1 Tax=Thelazia callipaeda TaxID=103827 RepID=A0A0N5CNJ2_THECL|nr:unnamed protein product [Thelazia callipaeda]